MRIEGSLINRMCEGQNIDNIVEGTDITMYYYTDRTCYYVTKVINQKDVFVLPYHVVADRDKACGMGHQDWLYFKTKDEEYEYLEKYIPNLVKYSHEEIPEEWCFTRNKWKRAVRHAPELIEERCIENGWDLEHYAKSYGFTNKELQRAKEGKEVVKYYDLSGKVSFGVRDYYYDWEF